MPTAAKRLGYVSARRTVARLDATRGAQGDHALHARLGRTGDNRRAVGVELLVVKMAVGVDHGQVPLAEQGLLSVRLREADAV